MTHLDLPTDAPISEVQQAWLAGYLAGLAAQRQVFGPRPGETPTHTLTVEVLYGTQTGNSEEVARQVAAAAGQRGLHAQVSSLDEMDLNRLVQAGHLLIVTSTYGDGEMPDTAALFWEALAADTAPRLEGLRYAVLALGDSGYDDFCAAGRMLDLRLEQLGAVRLTARVDCDVDFEEPTAQWTQNVMAQLAVQAPAGIGAGAGTNVSAVSSAPAKLSPAKWSRHNPYQSRLVVNRVLSAPTSAKEIRHLELAIGDSQIEYTAGDALAVMPVNDPLLVQELLTHLGADGEQPVGDVSLAQVLRQQTEIRQVSKDLLHLVADLAPSSDLAGLVSRGEREPLDHWLRGKDLLDVLRETGVRPRAAELVQVLRPLQPRAYSISSGPTASPDRIHLTVAAVRYPSSDPGRIHHGVCSTYLADRLRTEDPVGIWLQPNHAFGLPADDVPMVMIGPGTGIAPFRGFLQERAARGSTGRNWLFFGDQHRSADFIYADEIAEFERNGVLDRLDLAFSRDQTDKIYVQTLMREHGNELFSWLQDGASLFLCGDASKMAKDVEAALVQIVATHGPGDSEEAAHYVAELRRTKRLVRDVY